MQALIANNVSGTLVTCGEGKARVRDQGIFFLVHYEDDVEIHISKRSVDSNLREVKLKADQKRGD